VSLAQPLGVSINELQHMPKAAVTMHARMINQQRGQ
jgi:hypothetical protein